MVNYEIEKIAITTDQVAYDNTMSELNVLIGCLSKLFSELESNKNILYYDNTNTFDDSDNSTNLIDIFQYSIQEIKKEIWNTELAIKNKKKDLNKLIEEEKWVLLKNGYIFFNFSSLFKDIVNVEKLGDELLIITYADLFYAIVNYEGVVINYKILFYEILQNNLILLEKQDSKVQSDRKIYQILDFRGNIIIDCFFGFRKLNENVFCINDDSLYSSKGNYIGEIVDYFFKNNTRYIILSNNNLKGLFVEKEMVLKPEFDLIQIQKDTIIDD